MSYLEIFGFATGLVCVYFNAKENILGWPTAMLAVAVYGFIFFENKLYADMGLQIFFFIQSFYGLCLWFQRKGDKKINIQTIHFTDWLLVTGAVIIFYFIIYFVLTAFTDASMPVLDSITTSLSIVASYLLAKKKVENWILWLVADFIYVFMYYEKALFLTAALYLIYLFLASYGYYNWRRLMKEA